jgi:hypothetical protein
LNEVFDWIYDREQRREFRDKVARGQMRALKVVAGVALLSLGVWGGTSAYGEMKSNNERRELEQLGRLERAGAEYRDGNLESVVSLLSGEGLSQKHPRSLEWDTVFTFAATELGLQRLAASSGGETLLTQAMAHANRALNHQLLGVQARARIRFARAQACGTLQCGPGRQREDLQYVVANTRDRGLRRKANEALRELQ